MEDFLNNLAIVRGVGLSQNIASIMNEMLKIVALALGGDVAMASAAIAAMREPTPAMIEAMQREFEAHLELEPVETNKCAGRHIWVAGIKAAGGNRK